MATYGATSRRISYLWQVPLLLVSLGLFVAACVLFVNGRPIITLNQKLSGARELLKNDRPDAAVESINRLMASETLPRESEAQVHLLLAGALDASQKQQHGASVAANHLRIIEETQIALGQGAKPDGEIYRRLGESYEALGKSAEAISQYRQAIAMDPTRAIRLRRKVIDLQVTRSDWVPAQTSLDAFLVIKELTDAERGWGESTKATILIGRGEYVDAQRLLADALRHNTDPIAQAESRYQMGLCAWKLGNLGEAEKLILAARESFRGQHPLDSDAAYTLGKIVLEKGDAPSATKLFDEVLTRYPDSAVAPLAQLARGGCRIQNGDDAGGVSDLRIVTARAQSDRLRSNLSQSDASQSDVSLHDETVIALRRASAGLVVKTNYQSAVDVLVCEQSLDPNPSAGFFARLSDACEKRAQQAEQSVAEVPPSEQIRRSQLSREFFAKAADAQLSSSRLQLAAGEKQYAESFWKAIDLYDRATSPQNAAVAMELFVTDRADDAIAPDALLRLGRTYESIGESEKAISAYQRLRGAYAKNPASSKASVPLAMLYLNRNPKAVPQAEKVLLGVIEGDLAAAQNSDDYRRALVELGGLYWRQADFDKAIPRLELFMSQSAGDERFAEAAFLAAECYRGSAQKIDANVAQADSSGDSAEMARTFEQRKSLLSKSAELYDRAVAVYRVATPTREADKRYEKLAALRRADCAYDLGRYAEAIGLYETVAKRFADDPTAVAACVQIVNSYSAMNRPADARAANERARGLLARIPQEAFTAGPSDAGGFVMPKAYWEQWLKFTATASADAL